MKKKIKPEDLVKHYSQMILKANSVDKLVRIRVYINNNLNLTYEELDLLTYKLLNKREKLINKIRKNRVKVLLREIKINQK